MTLAARSGPRAPGRAGRARSDRGAAVHHGISLLLFVPNLFLGLVGAYLATLTAAAWRARLRGDGVTSIPGHARHRFIVAIAAHDEEQVLGETLLSLADADYPTSLYAVHVVADNCTDATVDIARSHGVEVHERVAPEAPGKGPALTWLLDRLRARGEPHDAVLILDADTVVAPAFLRVMDARLSRGERVIQGYYAVRDPDSSWVVGLRHAALAVRHYLRPLARNALGSSAGLHGNGMVLAADIMRGRRWSAHLTEDIEFEAELLLGGERVTFAADAVIEAEMPRRLEEARTQHARWERGRLEVARRYVPRLVRAAWHGRPTDRVRCGGAAVDQMIPPFSLLAMLTAPAGIASVVLWVMRRNGLSRTNLGLVVGAAAVQVAYLASGLRMVDAPATVWRALLRAPRFVVWKAGVLRSAARPGAAVPWTRTARNA